ncbi:DsbA family protein (plasmid) [Rhodococcus globerulus]|uniref:DsbA family protein n=1 Tax=Rhodococcus globerulus TaxID=33008 RepID=UPI0039ECDDF3
MSKNTGKNTRRGSVSFVEQNRRADRRRNTLIQIAVGAVLIGLVVAIGISVVAKKSANDASAAPQPTAVSENGAIRIGPADATVVAEVVEDFQCPACKQFEAQSGTTLSEIANSTESVAVDYRPIAILDRMSSTEFSSRAANAAYCVAATDSVIFAAWHSSMFAQQPPEGGSGLTDQQLVEIAKSAGASSDDVADCITEGRYLETVSANTNSMLDEGISGTPTVKVNGSAVNDLSPSGLQAAVTAAQQ